MDPIKIASVQDWPTPKNVTEVQSFVGFINFYHRFIPNFSHVASPLHRLTKRRNRGDGPDLKNRLSRN